MSVSPFHGYLKLAWIVVLRLSEISSLQSAYGPSNSESISGYSFERFLVSSGRKLPCSMPLHLGECGIMATTGLEKERP